MTITMITIICYITFLITFWLSAEIAGLRQSSNTYTPVLTYICKYYFIFNRLYEEDPFGAHLKVRLINDQRTAEVEFRNTFQPTGRNLSLCTLRLPIPSQCSYSMVSRIFRIGNQVQVAKRCLNFPEGYSTKFYRFIRGGSPLRSNPLPFYIPFLTEKVPLSYPFDRQIEPL